MKMETEQPFSFSKLDSFSKCPRRFFFRYILRRREEPGVHLLYGRAVHKGMEHDNLEKVKGRVAPLPELVDVGVNEFEVAHKEAGLEATTTDKFREEFARQTSFYEHTKARENVRPDPKSIEAPFEIDVSIGSAEKGDKQRSATIQGFVDVIDVDPLSGRRTIIDYKSGAKAHTEYDIDQSLQFPIYEQGAAADKARVISFVKTGRQKPTVKVASSSQSQASRWARALTWIADTIKGIRESIKTGRFDKCSPACTWCSAKACSFYDQCYGPGSAPPTLIQVETIRPVGTVEMPEWRGGPKKVVDSAAPAAILREDAKVGPAHVAQAGTTADTKGASNG